MEKKLCYFCKSKIRILGFDCRCGKHFCSKHRLPETHNCIFDHKTKEVNLLKEKILVDCSFKKIEEI